MRIAAAARILGVEPHVLRHWDDMDVVRPDRTASGHREYTQEHVRRMQVLRACQEVGLSLAEIRIVLHRHETDRAEVLSRRRDQLRAQRRRLEEAETFLEHVAECRHDLITRCPDCSGYAESGATGPVGVIAPAAAPRSRRNAPGG